ncbi:MAG: DUF4926 domain-containing protein [Propionivibrio sp.]|uniref:DUF4926 domain-containing protein n=1 Tax=Candidatus Propionivibrio dominans TaxID=2954373 RepID=A0A9D7IA00_9RHOO|nr:DUF4926 domain-containing protein [Candidatus Propionivibrio dominans]
MPNLGLEPGDVGVVVHVYGQGSAYEVEFLTMDGHTIGLETVDAADLDKQWAMPLFTNVSDWLLDLAPDTPISS